MGRTGLAWWVAAIALLPVGGVVALRYMHPLVMGPEAGALLLLSNLAALGGALLLVSEALTQTLFGFALGGLNRYTLARAQVAAWTVVVFSALLTAAEWNLALPFVGIKGPLDIVIPGELLTALGISMFTAVAAPAIIRLRSDTTTQATDAQMQAATDRTRSLMGQEPDLRARGQIVCNRTFKDASWRDLFTGEDVSVTGRVDLSKVQQALLTLIIISIYLAAILESFTRSVAMECLPPLGPDAVRLLAISHAGYLAYRAVPKPDAADSDPGSGVRAATAPVRMAAAGE